MGYRVALTDIKSDTELVDLTNLSETTRLSPRLNRPLGVEANLPATEPALQELFSDGDPVLWPGTRALKVWQDSELVAHTEIVSLSFTGGTEWDQKVLVSCLDPMYRLQTRQVWDSTHHLADPTFKTPINAGAMLKQAIDNSTQDWGDDSVIADPVTRYPVVPAVFPIATTGPITTTQDMGEFFSDGPQTIGDLLTALTDTGAVDVVMRPVDTSMGFAPGIMAEMSVSPNHGVDRSASVRFDYATGVFNVKTARRVLSVETVANKISYELGPKIGKDRWKGNITTVDMPDAYLHLALESRAKYGARHQVRVYDSDSENDSRPLFRALFKTELLLRHEARDLLYLQPVAAGANFSPVYRPFLDYNVGDIVAVGAGPVLGKPFSNARQRVYGFDVEINDLGVEEVAELITSADAE